MRGDLRGWAPFLEGHPVLPPTFEGGSKRMICHPVMEEEDRHHGGATDFREKGGNGVPYSLCEGDSQGFSGWNPI
jgi:hypothetical protein